jgi:hypothetical protein
MYLADRQPHEVDRVVELGIEIADALDAAHTPATISAEEC